MDELTILREALRRAVEDIADNNCPHEHGLYTGENCSRCSHDAEMHQNTDRDVCCWTAYYMQKAREGK